MLPDGKISIPISVVICDNMVQGFMENSIVKQDNQCVATHW
jgi:hypothetical protein